MQMLCRGSSRTPHVLQAQAQAHSSGCRLQTAARDSSLLLRCFRVRQSANPPVHRNLTVGQVWLDVWAAVNAHSAATKGETWDSEAAGCCLHDDKPCFLVVTQHAGGRWRRCRLLQITAGCSFTSS